MCGSALAVIYTVEYLYPNPVWESGKSDVDSGTSSQDYPTWLSVLIFCGIFLFLENKPRLNRIITRPSPDTIFYFFFLLSFLFLYAFIIKTAQNAFKFFDCYIVTTAMM